MVQVLPFVPGTYRGYLILLDESAGQFAYEMIANCGLPLPSAELSFDMLVGDGQGEIEKLLKTQDVKDRFQTLGADIMYLPPERFEQYVRAEIKKWSVVVKETGMRAD